MVGGMLVLYACLIMLANIPFVQKMLGQWGAEILANQIGAEVRIGRLNVGFFNRIIIDQLYIADQQGETLLKSDRAAAKINILSLLNGQVRISNAQLFGLSANLYRINPDAIPNYQFLLDAFASENNDEPSAIDLGINSFIMRRGKISYNVRSEAVKDEGIDPNHINISNADATISLKVFSQDSVNVTIKRLNFNEETSGLQLKNLQMQLTANAKEALITGFNLKTHQSSITFDDIRLAYPDFNKDKSFSYATRLNSSCICLTDFAPLYGKLSDFSAPLYLEANISGTDDSFDISNLDIHTDDDAIAIELDGQISGMRHKPLDIHADIHQLACSEAGRNMLMQLAGPDAAMPQFVNNLGRVAYEGTIDYSADFIALDGMLASQVGNVDLSASLYDGKRLAGKVAAQQFDLGSMLADSDLGTMTLNVDVTGLLDGRKLKGGEISGQINDFAYKGYAYKQANIAARLNGDDTELNVSLDDPLATVAINGVYGSMQSLFKGKANISHFNPHALGLTSSLEGETFRANIMADLQGATLNDIVGTVRIDSLAVATPNETLSLNRLNVEISQAGKSKQIDLATDFAQATLRGDIQLDGIVDAFQHQISDYLPSVISRRNANGNRFAFEATIQQSDILRHYVPNDYDFEQPIYLTGAIDSPADTMQFLIKAPKMVNDDKHYYDTQIRGTTAEGWLSVVASTSQRKDTNVVGYHLTADARNDKLDIFLSWDDKINGSSDGVVHAVAEFEDSLGLLKSDIKLEKSDFTINDTLWQVQPSHIQIYDGRYTCSHVKVYNDEQSMELNGTISNHDNDSLVVDLKNLQIAYVTDLVNFSAVRFKGKASGKAIIRNAINDLSLNANLVVNDFHLQEGRLGTGYIRAFWDKSIPGIQIFGDIRDNYKGKERSTRVSGFISPANNDIALRIDANNTNAEFLNGFLGSTFRDIAGNANGTINVVGPLSDINLVGDISADVAMRLRATNMLYHINPADTIHLRPYRFGFEDIRLTDVSGREAVLNGMVGHKNMKNFSYDFHIDMHELTIYDEHEFNSDKFLATVYADGTLDIHGSDGNPLRMTANITPAKGSVFAYDTATPDAISNANFVTFRDATPNLDAMSASDGVIRSPWMDDLEKAQEEASQKYEYHGDIDMDINMTITPDCEIKLRMDNSEDGYMSTYGYAKLLAHYYNKGAFTLNGNYNIEGGRYRLYLQDIIYRDLALQQGSKVEFNGNPFDANIHLICHHTLNSVPLRDLTSTLTLNQSARAKVVCILDITGKLGNMNFGFDIDLPNVNDEIKQLVRSYISTEEEMNMQMIYLLGLGRFYANEYARAAGESGSNQAMNTLLSSTISGQVNQMLSSVIGADSKWNFGTGLSTGEKGWNDLDIEGMLSGRLLNDRLLINGSFGYRDNTLTNTSNFIGDFDVRWRLTEMGNVFLKAYNQTNDRYFTKATLNTQGIGLSYQRDFDSWKSLLKNKAKDEERTKQKANNTKTENIKTK